MTTKNRSLDGSNKTKTSESIWKKALSSDSEWPDKVS